MNDRSCPAWTTADGFGWRKVHNSCECGTPLHDPDDLSSFPSLVIHCRKPATFFGVKGRVERRLCAKHFRELSPVPCEDEGD